MKWRPWIRPLMAAAIVVAALVLSGGMWDSSDSEPPVAARQDRSPVAAPSETESRTAVWPPRDPAEPAATRSTPPASRWDDSDREADSDAPADEISAEAVAQLDEELRFTDRALDSSRQLAEAFIEQKARPPTPAPSPAAARGVAAATRAACGGPGRSCLSSSDCCAGLACAGGVGGYGTRGVCEVAR